MTSLILQTAARVLHPAMLVASVFLFVRGHDEPGGGFVGGLLAAASFGLHSMAFGCRSAKEALRVDPRTLIGAGASLAVAVALAPLALGRPLLTSLWATASLPGWGEVSIGTPLAFDAAVYMIVSGATLAAVFALEEEEEEAEA